jgi:hypothetical protein
MGLLGSRFNIVPPAPERKFTLSFFGSQQQSNIRNYLGEWKLENLAVFVKKGNTEAYTSPERW